MPKTLRFFGRPCARRYVNLSMKKSALITIFFLPLAGCENSNWTEKFDYYGFKDGYESKLKYDVGGYTKLSVNVSSEAFDRLAYPLTLKIWINENVCVTKSLSVPTSNLLISASCERNLGPGVHILKARLESPDNFSNLSAEEDREFNHYHGSLTYILEKT